MEHIAAVLEEEEEGVGLYLFLNVYIYISISIHRICGNAGAKAMQ